MHLRKKKTPKNGNSSIRIIAGQWRGQKLTVIDAEGLRPTSNRIRETLFNWLAPYLPGSRCLDLFAGTGALGLEALSRGAKFTQFAETNNAAAEQLKANLARLNCERAQIYHGSALQLLEQPPEQPYDLVFLDPPFALNYWHDALQRLLDQQWLHTDSLVYMESPQKKPIDTANWFCHREKTAGDVRFGLYFPQDHGDSPHSEV